MNDVPGTQNLQQPISDIDVFLDKCFTYHPPKGDQAVRYGQIRYAAREFAKVVLMLTPKCADQTAAIRKIRETVMTANAAIACEE